MRDACEHVTAALTAAAAVEGLTLEDRAFMLRCRGKFMRIGGLPARSQLTTMGGDA